MTNTPHIRAATRADYTALAALQARSWADVYQGVLPEAYIAGEMTRDLTQFWAEMPLETGRFQLLAEADGQVVGFIAVYPKMDGPYIDNLHIDPEQKGRGIGRVLMQAAADHLIHSGQNSVYLTVVTTNTGAVSFYRAMGGEFSAPIADDMFGNPVEAYRVSWRNLPALAQKAR